MIGYEIMIVDGVQIIDIIGLFFLGFMNQYFIFIDIEEKLGLFKIGCLFWYGCCKWLNCDILCEDQGEF